MLRFGAEPPDNREMDLDDIFIARLKLLIIMAKAYLEDCPLGQYRRKAILENAEHIEAESVELGGLAANFRRPEKPGRTMAFDHVFYQRVKLLAVILKAVANGHPMGLHRKKALAENLEIICRSLTFSGRVKEMDFLKVA